MWRLCLTLWLALAAVVEAESRTDGAEGAADMPNVLLIYADDLGWSDPSYMGHSFYETPVLDRLAAQGMTFTNAYAAAANCAPSRAGMLSGRWASRHKLYNVESRTGNRDDALQDIVSTPTFRNTLEQDTANLGRLMADAGYRSSTVGKFHVGTKPLAFGFDGNVAGSAEGRPPTYYTPLKIANLRVSTPGLHLNDVLASHAVGEIQAAQLEQRPFFLLLSHFAVHTPMEPPLDLLSKYKKKPGHKDHWVEYAAMLEGLDRSTGDVLHYLDVTGLANNTLVIFSSDNGARDEKGRRNANRPLKGSKGMLYEGGIRVPMVARWPGVVPAGAISNEPVTQLDWFATLAAVAKVPAAASPSDGHSLIPILQGTQSMEERDLFWHFPSYLAGWGFQRIDARQTPASVIRRGKYKLIQYFEDCSVELFDLSKDLGERRNLAPTMPQLADALVESLTNWRRETDAETNTWIGFVPDNYRCLPRGEEDAILAQRELRTDKEEDAMNDLMGAIILMFRILSPEAASR